MSFTVAVGNNSETCAGWSTAWFILNPTQLVFSRSELQNCITDANQNFFHYYLVIQNEYNRTNSNQDKTYHAVCISFTCDTVQYKFAETDCLTEPVNQWQKQLYIMQLWISMFWPNKSLKYFFESGRSNKWYFQNRKCSYTMKEMS